MAACLDCGGSECVCTYKRMLAEKEEDSRLLDRVLDPEGPFKVLGPKQVPEHSTPVFSYQIILTRDDIRRVAGEGKDGG